MFDETNAQRLRMLIGWLGISERAAAVELGVSRTLLRSVLQGISLPDFDCKQRIEVMARRWPHGPIMSKDWPAPAEDRRQETSRQNGRKRAKAAKDLPNS
jgi:hypothetical protein